MTNREVIAMGHLMTAKQALIEVDFEAAHRALDRALEALQSRAIGPKGETNSSAYLSDASDGRRFWPVGDKK